MCLCVCHSCSQGGPVPPPSYIDGTASSGMMAEIKVNVEVCVQCVHVCTE